MTVALLCTLVKTAVDAALVAVVIPQYEARRGGAAADRQVFQSQDGQPLLLRRDGRDGAGSAESYDDHVEPAVVYGFRPDRGGFSAGKRQHRAVIEGFQEIAAG